MGLANNVASAYSESVLIFDATSAYYHTQVVPIIHAFTAVQRALRWRRRIRSTDRAKTTQTAKRTVSSAPPAQGFVRQISQNILDLY